MGERWELLWGPLRAICVLIGHFAVLTVLIIGFFYVDDLIAWFSGEEETLVWNLMPLKWLFQAIDVSMAIMLSYSAGLTIWWELEKYRKSKP